MSIAPNPDLFEHAASGEQLKKEGIDSVLANAKAAWKLEFARVAAEIAATGREFTSEDVTALAPCPDGTHPNAVGAAMHAFVCYAGLERCGYKKATHSEGHSRMIAVWRKPAGGAS